MKFVKAAWSKLDSGPRRDAALNNFQAAEKAHTAKNDTETSRQLNAVGEKLS